MTAAIGLPQTVKDFRKREKAFSAWLTENGSAVFAPTNLFEVIRFQTDQGVGTVYRNQANRITAWLNGTDKAFLAFANHQPWRACERGSRRPGSAKRRILYATLVARDGTACMFCAEPLTIDDATIEHIVAVTHGGTDHPSNLSLACSDCNKEADHLSAREKFEMAMTKRLARQQAIALSQPAPGGSPVHQETAA